jgi:hypothetical protein
MTHHLQEKKMSNQFRQGDVLIERIDALPDDLRQLDGPVILAEGEATGHAHAIRSKHATLFVRSSAPLPLPPAEEKFLRLDRPAGLVHQEHAPIVLDAGNYRVLRQREYTPEAIRNVID